MIRTYELSHDTKIPLYAQLYEAIRADILSGTLPGGEKLPSKRALAEHLSLSKITVETAYAQLLEEGYLTSRERSGYFVAHMPLLAKAPVSGAPEVDIAPEIAPAQRAVVELFPFSVWAKLMRGVILDEGQYLLQPVPNPGLLPLRQAIAGELARQRGLVVRPEQILIGAGTEYFYTLLVQFLGRGQRFAIEDPCHRTLAQVYQKSGAEVVPVSMDDSGIRVDELERSGAQIVHLSPSHQYPTGTVMPITRRQELLAWMERAEGRFLIEDDYDSEFRFSGRPVPTLQSLDRKGRVIYLNTFSKTIAPALRISYMILPQALLARWKETMGFYSCAVPSFEQLTLTRFLDGGYFERHVSRMKKHYKTLCQTLLDILSQPEFSGLCQARQAVAGLHFLLEFHTKEQGTQLKAALEEAGLHAPLLSEFYLREGPQAAQRCAVVQYSGLEAESFERSMQCLAARLTPEREEALPPDGDGQI